MQHYFTLLFVVIVFLSGCAPTGRYHQEHDSAPAVLPSQVTDQDAIPVYAPYNKANLKPYTIRGVHYRPLETAKGYSVTGGASWYGQKFHGHHTANGEVYDMYQMTAAHKTLPLPSYVRVTNLDNGKQVVVKVNDRGPFHPGRVIDLSYAAALKLDMLKTGTTEVKVDAIYLDETGQMSIGQDRVIAPKSDATKAQKKVFIQVAALQNKTQIDKIASGLQLLYQRPYQTLVEQNIYKLRLGPIANPLEADALLEELKINGFSGAFKIYLD